MLRTLQLLNVALIFSAAGWFLSHAIDLPWQMYVILIGGALIGATCALWGTRTTSGSTTVLQGLRTWWQHLLILCLFTYIASALLGLVFIGIPTFFSQNLEKYKFCATQTPTGDNVCENEY